MDYEKKYKEALERATKAKNNASLNEGTIRVLGIIFPELRESKDERIRKAIKYCIKQGFIGCGKIENVTPDECLAWIEKQAPKPQGKTALEAIHEEKVDNANKIMPKFKVGDWCIDNEDGVIFQIVKVLDNTYIYKTIEGKEYSCTHYSLENDARLWTIQDAKDGDVLANSHGTFIFMGESDGYCGVLSDSTFIRNTGNNEWTEGLHPTTKEQRDTLFAEMKEAGYEWDAGKKDLGKIRK